MHFNMLAIKEIQSGQEWEDFLLKQPFTPFVQSFQYGKFFESIGEQFWILGIYENNQLAGGSLIVSTHAKRGNFLYLPYGPMFDPRLDFESAFGEFISHLKQLAQKNDYDFIRISPFWDDNEKNKNLFKKCGFRDAPMHVLAENTWILDLSSSYHEILLNMEKNHRYLIRRCEKENVKIEKFNYAAALGDFNKLLSVTAKRHKFHRFSDDYISKEFEAFAPQDQTLILDAFLSDGTLDSTAIIMYYGNMAVYRHGASLGADKKLPTSYLLQWEAIKEAKKRGIKWYNFWGIAPQNASKKHPFYGITHFKKGFGGFSKNLIHCQDLPINKKYWLNWIVETFRRQKRGF